MIFVTNDKSNWSIPNPIPPAKKAIGIPNIILTKNKKLYFDLTSSMMAITFYSLSSMSIESIELKLLSKNQRFAYILS